MVEIPHHTSIFLLGAGFNADAAHEAGPIHIGHSRIVCGYPLVTDALRLCFELDRLPKNKSVEDLFSEALASHDYDPIEKLGQRLMEADHYLATELATSGESNSYREFFETFAGSHFLTFNHDSLPETLLFRMGRWFPHDGYGVAVRTELPPQIEGFTAGTSASFILHLHGTLCVRTSEFETKSKGSDTMRWLVPREKPAYFFDPHSISSNFSPFGRLPGGFDIEDRMIAPVTDKSEGLTRAFLRKAYDNAVALVRASGTVVVIGYSFNVHDRGSYEPILRALGDSVDRRLIVVSPDAQRVAARLRLEFPVIRIEAICKTFKDWAGAAFESVTPNCPVKGSRGQEH